METIYWYKIKWLWKEVNIFWSRFSHFVTNVSDWHFKQFSNLWYQQMSSFFVKIVNNLGGPKNGKKFTEATYNKFQILEHFCHLPLLSTRIFGVSRLPD